MLAIFLSTVMPVTLDKGWIGLSLLPLRLTVTLRSPRCQLAGERTCCFSVSLSRRNDPSVPSRSAHPEMGTPEGGGQAKSDSLPVHVPSTPGDPKSRRTCLLGHAEEIKN